MTDDFTPGRGSYGESPGQLPGKTWLVLVNRLLDYLQDSATVQHTYPNVTHWNLMKPQRTLESFIA